MTLPEMKFDTPEEWVEPPEGTSFGARQSLWADWMGRRFATPRSQSFVWNNGNPYLVIQGWDPICRRALE